MDVEGILLLLLMTKNNNSTPVNRIELKGGSDDCMVKNLKKKSCLTVSVTQLSLHVSAPTTGHQHFQMVWVEMNLQFLDD